MSAFKWDSNTKPNQRQYLVWGNVSQLPFHRHYEDDQQVIICDEIIIYNIEIDREGNFTGYFFDEDSQIIESYQKDLQFQFKRMISAEEFRCITTLSDLKSAK
ncbi:hypothetical protein CTN07_20505 [Photobacterium damselae]|uniref:Uncharacterized protein n=1 Tax=Photobacterium damselae TaxID=38293 RepID=A0A2T3Q6V5_PHODM|nr:hypothetical protein CTN07_20505 [Photobacterium damselae]SPY45186.1 Uncharacterised protein [Photobacterium damselae]